MKPVIALPWWLALPALTAVAVVYLAFLFLAGLLLILLLVLIVVVALLPPRKKMSRK